MRVPRIMRSVETAKRDASGSNPLRHAILPAAIAKKPCKKKRADKLRALASAFKMDDDHPMQERRHPDPIQADPLQAKYIMHEEIAQGKQGVRVSRCTSRETGEAYAAKLVPKALLGRTHGDERPAVSLLSDLPNIITTREVVETPSTLCYIMELAQGGDLFHHVDMHGALPEPQARAIFTGLVRALVQVHCRGQIHRDVKLENILLMTQDPAAEDVRLADLEFCTTTPAIGPVGSIAHAAPEVRRGGEYYSAGVDIWAAGVVLYSMLSASAPFDCRGDCQATTERTQAGPDMNDLVWEQVSAQAKDLIRGMLAASPHERLDLEQVLLHPWLSSAGARSPKPKLSLRCTWSVSQHKWAACAPASESNPATSAVAIDPMERDEEPMSLSKSC